MTTRWMAALATGLATVSAAAPAPPPAVPTRPVPYWASLVAGEARMRTGPGRQFPAIWLYRRVGLPLRVVQVAPGWRRVRDQDGAEGWMLVNLLSDRRTGVVTGGVRPVRESPVADAPARWQAQPGVVGRIDHCTGGWCRFTAQGHEGYVEADHLWGLDPAEVVE